MADISELQVQITLTIGELKELVALINFASEGLPEDGQPEVIADVSGLYFELMESLHQDGLIGRFQSE